MSERGYVDRLGTAVEDQFRHAEANGGGDLEACAAKAAGQIEPLWSRLAEDGPLVRGDAVNAAANDEYVCRVIQSYSYS